MCLMVYVGSKEPLELVAWNEAIPAFHVSELDDIESSVRRQFRAPHVYYVGSSEGCGCGFQYGEYPEFEEEAERAEKRADLDALAFYLARQLPRVGRIQLYACWDGDQSATPEHRRNLTPESLRSDDFFFLEKELSTVDER